MKKWQKIVLGSFLVVVVGFVIAKGYLHYLKSKPHRDVSKEQAITVSAVDIFNEFNQDEATANQRYLNKAVAVSGRIASVIQNQEGRTVVLLSTEDPVFGVNCTFRESPGNLQPGDSIIFKGICTGFLSDVVVNEGVLIKN